MAHEHDPAEIAIGEQRHDHFHDGDGTYGMAFGFRTLAKGDGLFLVEAEVAPYVDEPSELGATLVFHPLEWVDPNPETDAELPAWVIDIDDDLTRRTSEPIASQFAAIVRQLHQLPEAKLLEYLELAQQEGEAHS